MMLSRANLIIIIIIINMRNKLRPTAERLMRLVVQADKGYTPLKLKGTTCKMM